MGHEQLPGDRPPIDSLDNLVRDNGSAFVVAEMKAYVRHMFEGDGDWFPEDTGRIDKIGEQLASRLTKPPIKSERIVGLTRCLRFGLRMSLFTAGDDAYKETLTRIEDVLQMPTEAVSAHIEQSYERFLEHQPHLMPALRDNLFPIAPAEYQVLGQNIISTALEFTDHYVYSRTQAQHLNDVISKLLAPPEGRDTEGGQ